MTQSSQEPPLLVRSLTMSMLGVPYSPIVPASWARVERLEKCANMLAELNTKLQLSMTITMFQLSESEGQLIVRLTGVAAHD
jgi:hypothetical protein